MITFKKIKSVLSKAAFNPKGKDSNPLTRLIVQNSSKDYLTQRAIEAIQTNDPMLAIQLLAVVVVYNESDQNSEQSGTGA